MSDEPSSNGWLGRLLGKNDEAPLNGPSAASAASKTRMINAAEQFHNLRVEDVMVPRADIIGIEQNAGLQELSQAFETAGHSRLPVYNDSLDEPIGMVHIKDVFPFLMLNAKGRSQKSYPQKKIIKTIMRPVLFVPPSMQAQDLLRRMQARRMHMAIVVDEYGGTDGILTIEDLIEPIVGDIDDEHDEAVPKLKKIPSPKGKSIWEADARVTIDALEEAVGRDFASLEEEAEVDTLGGLVFTLAGRVPDRGEIIRHPDGVEFEVLDADPRKVKMLRVVSTDPDPSDGSDSGQDG